MAVRAPIVARDVVWSGAKNYWENIEKLNIL